MQALVIGIVSGILSSIIISFVLFGVKPKVLISDKISRDPRDNKYKIKIVNLSKVNLIDVKYSLHYCRRFVDGIGVLSEIQPTKSRLEFIKAFSATDQHADYAVRITYSMDESFCFGDNDSVIFTFYAKHAFSGTATFIRKEYTVADITCGHFETRKSTNILVEPSCQKVYGTCKAEECPVAGK